MERGKHERKFKNKIEWYLEMLLPHFPYRLKVFYTD